MSRCLLLLILVIGVATAWKYRAGFDSHPWNRRNVWVKRSSEKPEEDLPQPIVRENAKQAEYIHKRNGADSTNVEAVTEELPQPIVRENAKQAEYIHKRNGAATTNVEAAIEELPQPIVREKMAEYIHKRNGASQANAETTADLPQPIVRQNAESIRGYPWF